MKQAKDSIDEIANSRCAKTKFDQLKEDWKKETVGKSSISAISLNLNYLKIIALGEEVVPFIIEELRQENGHWFLALQALTGENPAIDCAPGKMEDFRQAWLNWYETRRLENFPEK